MLLLRSARRSGRPVNLNLMRPSVPAAARSLGGRRTRAANRPQRSIFYRFFVQYPDIGLQNRQKLSSLGPIFAATRSAAQAPSKNPAKRSARWPLWAAGVQRLKAVAAPYGFGVAMFYIAAYAYLYWA